MATKSETIAFLKKHYIHEDLEDHFLKIVLESADSDRSQIVWAWVYDDFLSFASPFARIGHISDSQALDSNESLLGIGKLSEFYVVRHLLELENVDENEIVEGLRYIATVADAQEARLGLGDDL